MPFDPNTKQTERRIVNDELFSIFRLHDDEAFHDIENSMLWNGMTVLKWWVRKRRTRRIAGEMKKKINFRDESDLMIDTSKWDFITFEPYKIWQAADFIRFSLYHVALDQLFLWHLKMTRTTYIYKMWWDRIVSEKGNKPINEIPYLLAYRRIEISRNGEGWWISWAMTQFKRLLYLFFNQIRLLASFVLV